ncbi:MAG: hypothetical protein KC613_05765 [Myxococcales bacterium]|nr:hypothetical protein [Myxococcales bacterium]
MPRFPVPLLAALLAGCLSDVPTDVATCASETASDGRTIITCPGADPVIVEDGDDCAVAEAGEGAYELRCGDAPPVTVRDGKDGADGAPGSELGAGAIAQLESAPISNPPMSARWATARFDPPLAVSGEAVFVAAEWPEVEPEQTAFTGLDLHPAQTGGWVFIPGEGWVALADALVPELQPAEPLAQATVSIDARLVADDPVMLSNTGLHCPDYGPGMLTNETAGGWSVTRLTPAGWPFQVEQIGYELVHRPGQGPPGCTATAPHAVVVFVSGETPADDAPLLQRFDVALDEGDVPRDHAPVRLDLDEAVTLQQGESLYVAIEMPGDAVRSCLAVCFPEQAPAANFFTQQGPGISPFVTLEEGLNLQPDHLGDPTVKAWGHPAPTDGVD